MTYRVFLSASVPDPRRDARYYQTADIVAIREAVRGLATVFIPRAGAELVWGGHPAITPLIRVVVSSMGANVRDHVHLYQSEDYRKDAPSDNDQFERVTWVRSSGERSASLTAMREQMLQHAFDAGVFIGGMDGVEEEFQLFRTRHPTALVLPVASTGAAARILFDQHRHDFDADLAVMLEHEYAYMSLFRRTIANKMDQ